MSEEEIVMTRKKSEAPPPKRKPKKIIIPRRAPSIVIPKPSPIFITPDKTTCVECTCFPKEDPYVKNKKLNQCQKSPLSLYELAADVVDRLKFPEALNWREDEVADWLADVGYPQYRECILDNKINGMRLLMLEDPSKLPEINIKNWDHIKIITAKVRELFSTELIKFVRSLSLPPRKPLTHCTWFKSRTGPSWGIRKNWNRCNILRWMKILMPEPIYLNHWDLVWYQKPDFPSVKFARVPKPESQFYIPIYKPQEDVCREYMVPRKFKLQTGITDSKQFIWMERIPERKKKVKKVKTVTVPKESRLVPKKISITGLTGEELILARRKMNKPKFLA